MHMYTPIRQAGKGLISFIVGLLIATAIIAGILFYLNKSKSDFKTPAIPEASAPQKPEILTPDNSASATQPFIPDGATSASSNSPSQTVPPASEPLNIGGIENQVTGVHTPTTRPNEEHKEPAKTPKKVPSGGSKTHVTPEQILSNGSLEKAQQAAEKQHTGNKVYLQIGSYSNRTDADAQRAKLVMLGINSTVQTAKVNGTTKYRVQTDNLNQNQAGQIKKILQQHNIDSLTRAAS